MDSKHKLTLVAAFFGLAAVYVLIHVTGRYKLVSTYRVRYPVATGGRIESVGRQAGSGTWSFPKYTVRYQAGDGRSYTVTNAKRMDAVYHIGDSLAVRYSADNPKEATIDDHSQLEGDLKRGIIAAGLLSLVFIVILLSRLSS